MKQIALHPRVSALHRERGSSLEQLELCCDIFSYELQVAVSVGLLTRIAERLECGQRLAVVHVRRREVSEEVLGCSEIVVGPGKLGARVVGIEER